MRRTLTILAILSLVVSSAACFKHTYALGTGAPEGEVVYKHWHHHWLFGLIRPELQKQLDVDALCPSGNVTVHQEQSFANGLVAVLIGLIYSPTTVTVQCEGAEMAEVTLPAATVAAITLDPLFLDYVREVAPERLAEAQAALDRGPTTVHETELIAAPR